MRHVPTGYKEIQGRQGPLLLEHGGERARRSSRLPAPGALPRRAERLAARGMAAHHRGLRRERQRQAAEALPGRPRAGDRRRAGRAHPQATHGRRAARNLAPAAGSRLLWADTK